MKYIILFFIILGLDQLSKWLVSLNMALGESNAVISDFFHITYIRNTGAAFSMFAEHTLVLGLFAGVVVLGLLIFVFLKRKTASPLFLISLVMIASGGMGNVIDRLARGYVVDFFDFRVFPVFNVADIFVTLGCTLILFYTIFIDDKNIAVR